mgnify:CR=1 FL=1
MRFLTTALHNKDADMIYKLMISMVDKIIGDNSLISKAKQTGSRSCTHLDLSNNHHTSIDNSILVYYR